MTRPRTVLVTGGTRGIGLGIARRLAEPGTVVGVHFGHDDHAARCAVDELEETGATAFAVRADLTEPGAPEQLAEDTTAALRELTGDAGLDVLVNNAGVGCRADIATITPEDLDRVLAINVKAPVFVVQRLLPLMGAGGRIVNVSSVASRVAHPHVLGYAMSKGALDAFGRSLAAQLGPRGITVNTVAPGLVDTGFHGGRLDDPAALARAEALTMYGRLATVADVADVVAFLVSEPSRWVTGERIELTGGAYL